MKTLFCAALVASLLFTQNAQASGDYTNIWAVVKGTSCRAARDSKTPIRAGSSCQVAVHFDFSSCNAKDLLTSCYYYLPEGRKLMYWFERRKNSHQNWKRFTQPRVFDRNAIDENTTLALGNTYEYRIAFDSYGMTAFGDEFTDTFKLFVKGR